MPSVKQPIRNTIAMLMSRRRKRVAMTVCSFDDESSVTSTFSAHCVPLYKAPRPVDTITTTTTTTTNKSVGFNEEHNESYDNTQMCKEDTIDLWYTTGDLASFKFENNELAKEITRSERSIQAVYSYQRVIQRLYDACLKQPFESDEEQQDDDDKLLLLSVKDSMHFQEWLNNSAMGRLGLERKSVRSIAKDSHFRRKDIYKMVSEIQEMAASSTTSLEEEDKAEFLRQSCQALSRPSRLFAHELAVAQAAAAERC